MESSRSETRQLSSYHIQNTDVAIGKHYRIWWRCNRQHEREGSAESTGQHNIQGMDPDRCGLQWNGESITLEVF